MFRRRRIVVGVGLIVVITLLVIVVNAVVGFVNGIFNPGGGATATPTATGDPNAACQAGVVSVIAGVGDQNLNAMTTFGASDTPYLWFKLTNNSTAPCTFDAGTLGSFYKITSGSTVIWDSHDCDRSQDVSSPIVLQPGATVSSPASSWMKVYSSSTGCSTGQKAAPGKGASYHLVATVNNVTSSDVQFMLN
ncbi:MAG: hypothetical protein RLZZ164_254 [Actinomycetota bacterium]|jgi:hypothetical protein